MHTWVLIAVEAEDEDGARMAADDALEPYLDQTYDWHEIGGRWAGMLDGSSIIGARKNPVRFAHWVNEAQRTHNGAYNANRRALLGEPVTPEEAAEEAILPTDDTEALAERLSEHNRQTAAEFQRLLASSEPPSDYETQMAAWRLMRFARLAGDHFCPETFFWDARNGTAKPEALLRDMVDPELSGGLWVVCVDMHY